MLVYAQLAGVLAAALGSLLFSSLTYSLRDMSRARLAHWLQLRGKSQWLDEIMDHADDLIRATAACRLLFNILLLVGVLRLQYSPTTSLTMQYFLAVVIAGVISLFCSVILPHAAARYASNQIVAGCAEPLRLLLKFMAPLTWIMSGTDELVRRAVGMNTEPEPEHIEQEILSAVEEGAKEGVVDEHEKEMIESVIELRDTTANQIMASRADMVTLPATATLAQIKEEIEQSGHSRIPIYEGSLDHIIGFLYARDLLKHVGQPPEQFNLRAVMRPALFVPETKFVRDLLQDFRLQKVHMAIVLDEYGGTAGLVTIEDIVEELVGEIVDEHEPSEPAMLKRISDSIWEADARLLLDELNRIIGLNLPTEAGYDTLGGFVTTTLGQVPAAGTVFEHGGTKYLILDAEPQKVNRVRIELALQASSEPKAE